MQKITKLLMILALIMTMGVVAGCNDDSTDANIDQSNANVDQPAGNVVNEKGADKTEPEAVKDYGTIEVIDKSGNSKKVELGSLEVVSGIGGIKKSTGTIIGPASVSGIKLSDLLADAGGITAEDTIEIIATDGYVATLTGKQALGEVTMYNKDGEPVTDRKITAIVMVESENAELAESLPRIAFIADKNVLTDGTLWAKQVGTIKITGPSAQSKPEEKPADKAPVEEKPATAGWSVKLEGVSQEAFTNLDVEKITAVDVKATHRSREGVETEQVWTGILIKDLLKYLNAESATEVTIESTDGFNRVYDHELISSDGTLVAWKVDGQVLDADSGPIQSVADGKGPNWWIKQVAKISIK
jgi:hypothetical protein